MKARTILLIVFTVKGIFCWGQVATQSQNIQADEWAKNPTTFKYSLKYEKKAKEDYLTQYRKRYITNIDTNFYRKVTTLQFERARNKSNTVVPDSDKRLPADMILVSRMDYNLDINKGDSTEANWKTYSNSKLGFSFLYPSKWKKEDKDVEIIDRMGTPIIITITLVDTTSSTTLLIKYHLPPGGIDVYGNIVSQYNASKGLYAKGGNIIKIGGNDAFEISKTITIDGRGIKLNPQLRLIIVDFINQDKTAEIQIQLKTPMGHSDAEVANFNRVLSTFNFIKD